MERIVVIDDEEPIRELVMEFLRREGYETFGAENGHAGLALARQVVPDLIISDINMPGFSGYQLLSEVRNDSVIGATPFIFLSGKAAAADMRAGMNLGADDYLFKPFTRLDLIKAATVRLEKQKSVAIQYDAKFDQAKVDFHRMMHVDKLTGLPNQFSLVSQFDELLKQTSDLAVLSLAFLRLERIRGAFGGDFANLFTQDAAKRLSSCVRSEDLIARVGQDHFVLLMPVAGPAQAADLAGRILETMQSPFQIGDQTVFASARIGIALYPDHGVGIDTLIHNADIARNSFNEDQGTAVCFYSKPSDIQSVQDLTLEDELHRALRNGEFELFYQPQVDLRTQCIIGAEALIRWRHPSRGFIPPNQFLPLAEQTGLILPIGDYVLRTAARQARKWNETQYLRMAVNISLVQFNRDNFVTNVTDILREEQVSPTMMELEITENMVLGDADGAAEKLKTLRSLGFQVSIDDFGTGYSSLSYLKRFCFDCLKLDQCFIRNVDADKTNADIVNAITRIAHGLNLRVVAEGVESEEELQFLKLAGCDEMQGYLFSRPVPAPEFELLLRAGKTLHPPQTQTVDGATLRYSEAIHQGEARS